MSDAREKKYYSLWLSICRPGLEDFMKELVAKQVKKTVDGNIGDYIAVPLAKQKEVALMMAKKIDVELDNSCVAHLRRRWAEFRR